MLHVWKLFPNKMHINLQGKINTSSYFCLGYFIVVSSVPGFSLWCSKSNELLIKFYRKKNICVFRTHANSLMKWNIAKQLLELPEFIYMHICSCCTEYWNKYHISYRMILYVWYPSKKVMLAMSHTEVWYLYNAGLSAVCVLSFRFLWTKVYWHISMAFACCNLPLQ